MKYEIAKMANRLCELLEFYNDAYFVDMVCNAIACNAPINIDEIEEN